MIAHRLKIFNENKRDIRAVHFPNDFELFRVDGVNTKAVVITICENAVQRANYLNRQLFYGKIVED